MNTSVIAVGALVLLVFIRDARPLTLSIELAPLLITAGDPDAPMYARLPNSAFDGVGALQLEFNNLISNCTGSLMGSGRHVLTAAHCVTERDGTVPKVKGYVTFQSSAGGEETIGITQPSVHPSWTGDLRAGGDIAVLTLQRPASAAIPRYHLYSRDDESGRIVELIGVGVSGTGAEGFTIEDGRRRGGYNRLDGTFVGTFDRFEGWTAGANSLLIDFDDGSAAHDALSVFGLLDKGTGLGEVFPFSGDSGGPAFLDGSIAAVSSFRTRVFRDDGTSPDIDDVRNGSFGEISGLTRVSRYEDWISARVSAIPEPGTLLLLGSVTFGFLARKSLYRRSR